MLSACFKQAERKKEDCSKGFFAFLITNGELEDRTSRICIRDLL